MTLNNTSTPTTLTPPYDTTRRAPDQATYDKRLHTWMATGSNAIRIAREYLNPTDTVAIDIETAGTDADRFDIKCVTASWKNTTNNIVGDYYSILLDPRNKDQAAAIRHVTDTAHFLVFHGGTFDIPPLVCYQHMTLDSIDKVWDTLVLARQLYTNEISGRTLEDLVAKHTHMKDSNIKIDDTFHAMGWRKTEGYRNMDIDSPVYCMGAMSDTLGTLQVFQPLHDAILRKYGNHYVSKMDMGQEDAAHKAQYLINREQITNRAMLRRSALGIKINTDYLQQYRKEVDDRTGVIRDNFLKIGIDPDSGTSNRELLEYLQDQGELPPDWETTATGMLKADKKSLAQLDNPLAQQITEYRNMHKVLGYLEKVELMARRTGRVYPQVQVLGASATGRMSYTNPELQQFPDQARPILVADEGTEWVSVDWSSIEPVVIGNAARDHDFIEPFNHGHDLYVPVAKKMGLIPQDMPEEEAKEHPARKRVKTVFLGTLYGQGPTSLGKAQGISTEEAQDLIDSIFDNMPKVRELITATKDFASRNGYVTTLDGRVLDIGTSTRGKGYRTHTAGNYLTQGSAYSTLSETLNTLYKQGISDAVYLAVHDEVVVDKRHVDQVRKIMETPPEWLNQAAGRTVKLMSDANDMGNHWKYV